MEAGASAARRRPPSTASSPTRADRRRLPGGIQPVGRRRCRTLRHLPRQPVVLIGILTLLVIYVTMVYGPIAAALVELFPTRIRYTSMSLPYHIGNGWFGGLLPATCFAMIAQTGDIYFGLWYPVVDRVDDGGHRADLHPGNQGPGHLCRGQHPALNGDGTHWRGALPLSKPHPAKGLRASGHQYLATGKRARPKGRRRIGPNTRIIPGTVQDGSFFTPKPTPRPTPGIGVQRPLGLWWGRSGGGKALSGSHLSRPAPLTQRNTPAPAFGHLPVQRPAVQAPAPGKRTAKTNGRELQ